MLTLQEIHRLARAIATHPEQWDIELLTEGCEAMAEAARNGQTTA